MSREGGPSLSGQDLAFLAWESEHRPMHIAATLEFDRLDGRPHSLGALRALLQPGLEAEPMLARRLQRSWLRRARWSEPGPIDVEAHVRALSAAARDEESASATRARVLATPLDPSRPLWEIWLDDLGPGHASTVLHVKLHHVLVDGVGAVALLERLLGRKRDPRLAASAARRASSPPRSASQTSRSVGTPRRAGERAGARRLLAAVRDQLRAGPRTPLNGAVGPARTFDVFSLDDDAFQRARRALGVGHNDLLLAAVAGGVEQWLGDESVDGAPAEIRAFVPVSLRAAGERGPGNRIAPWLVPLPLAERDPAARVRRIQAETRRLRRAGAAQGGDGVARWVRRLGPWLARLGMRLAAWRRAYQIVVTNVPGPRRGLALSGGRLSRLAAFPPLFPGQRVCVALVRHGDRVDLSLHTGFEDPARAAALAGALRTAFLELGVAGPLSDRNGYSTAAGRSMRAPWSRAPSSGSSASSCRSRPAS